MSSCEIFSKSLEPRSRYLSYWILTVRTVKKVLLHQYAKFRHNHSNRGRDIAIFQDGGFKMAAAAILDFRNFEFLMLGRVTSVELRHRTKFRRNSSNRGGDVSFNIMLVRLENAYSRHFLGVFGAHFPT